jgi:Ca2+-binding EF-hand superfamily protein
LAVAAAELAQQLA